MNNEKLKIGEFIYALRREKGLSQTELGDMVSVSNRAVSKWETGESNPELSIIPRLAEILGVSADELLRGRRDPEKPQADGQKQDGFASPFFLGRFFRIKGEWTDTDTKVEFTSYRRNKKGQPYLHINYGHEADGSPCKAQGTVAIGNRAKGLVALGFIARGLVSVGLVSVGLVSVGLLAVGLLCAGLFTLGLLAAGAVAAGGAAVGAVAVGIVAVGAVAVGVMSVGALSVGLYAWTGTNGIAFGPNIFITDSALRFTLSSRLPLAAYHALPAPALWSQTAALPPLF